MTFNIIETQTLTDISAEGTVYQHDKTGAKVIILENDDTNKAFTIGFTTLPYNDNGIAHILEHSVLNGSKKYPTKEPFVELLKGSLKTFLNAFTSPDKTVYPVSSTNQQDFHNLMSVYLDAVFQPNLYHDHQILQQEGWHYHLENTDDELIYKGVVYNEMKGAFASPEYKLYREVAKALYPNSIYYYSSGGDPDAIPSLTQEEFVAFHQQYYHPSNSITVVYGNADKEDALSLLEDYFSKYDALSERMSPTFEPKIPTSSSVTSPYSLSPNENPQNRDYLSTAWHVGTVEEELDLYGLDILGQILMGNQVSILKKALLQTGLFGDVWYSYQSLGFPSFFAIESSFTSREHVAQFNKTIDDTLTKIVEDGLDPKVVEAALNLNEFKLREMLISQGNPKGIMFALNILGNAMYDQPVLAPLHFSEKFAKLRELASQGYFESLIERKLLHNKHRVSVELVATPGKNDAQEKQVLADLKAYKAQLSDTQLHDIVNETNALIQRQVTPDKPEDLATIPTLTKSDLSTDFSLAPFTAETLSNGVALYHSEIFTSGIDYMTWYINVDDFSPEELSTLSFVSELMREQAVGNLSAEDFQTQKDLYTGGIAVQIAATQNRDGSFSNQLVMTGKSLEGFFDKLIELMNGMLCHSNFNETNRGKEIVNVLLNDFNQGIANSAHSIAMSRALAQVSEKAVTKEMTGGIAFYQYLKKLAPQFDVEDSIETVYQTFKSLYHKLANRQRVSILYIGPKARLSSMKEQLVAWSNSLPVYEVGEKVTIQTLPRQKEAFIAAQEVNYVALASKTPQDYEYSGRDAILSSILRFDYLWNAIRVQGGAYGAIYQHTQLGDWLLGSYRDPNILNTLAVYQAMPQFVQDVEVSSRELVKHTIGAFAPLEAPLSAYEKGLQAFNYYRNGWDANDTMKLKESILNTSMDTIHEMHAMLTTMLENASIVVIGNATKINESSTEFDMISSLFDENDNQ